MASINGQLLHAAVDHAIDLTRYGNGVIRRVIATLNKADADLFAALMAALQRMPADSFTVERLDTLLADVRSLNKTAYAQVRRGIEGELRDLVDYEAGYQMQLFEAMLPVQVSVASVSAGQVYAAALSRPFQGRLLSEWAAGIEAGKMARIRDAIRMGFIEGQTIDQMARAIRGTRARGYEDGIIEIDRRNAASVVRTAVAHTANFTRQRFYDQNSDIIKGLRWTATLDSRTSAVCRARDGKTFPLNSGPRPPAHWGCRSTMAPVLKSWRDIGIDMDELPPSARASMDGQVPEDLSYQSWLKQQPASRQDDILGPSRGKLFRQGDMPLDRFVDRSGRELTLDELRRKNAEAFQRAGL